MDRIYLDYNASTPIDPRVTSAMKALLDEPFGNPSSGHWASGSARDVLAAARSKVAASIGANADEIILTSGCSEANNLALKGSYYGLSSVGNHIISQVTEHPAVLRTLEFLQGLGAQVTLLPVNSTGRVDPEAVRAAINAKTILISIMHANNETGTVQPLAAIAQVAREHGVRFHTDAAQSLGKIPVDVDQLGVDLLSIAGHKLYAPKGVGALYARRGHDLVPLIHGAGHEDGRRAGTESIFLAAALGEACELAARFDDVRDIEALRDYFWRQLTAQFGDQVRLNGHIEERLPNTLNVSFLGFDGNELLARMPEIAASTGSACHSGRSQLSPVLAAMGIDEKCGLGTVRFSFGRGTTRKQVDAVLAQLALQIER
jgi:cysteine desulfurase